MAVLHQNTSATKNAPGTKLILRKFGETSSVKGLGKFLKSRSSGLKVLWLATLVGGGSYAVYLTVLLVSGYLNHSVTTSVRKLRESPEFPDISICNLSPLNERVVNLFNFSYFMNEFHKLRMSHDRYDIGSEAGTKMFQALLNTSEFNHKAALSMLNQISGLSGFFETLPYPARLALDMQQSNVLDCKVYNWENSEMSLTCADMLTYIFSIQGYHSCWTFRLPDNVTTDVKGISTIIYLDNIHDQVLPFFGHSLHGSTATGIRLLVHPRYTVPEMENGVSIPAGQETTIKIGAMKRKLLSQPYGQCTDEEYIKDWTPDVRVNSAPSYPSSYQASDQESGYNPKTNFNKRRRYTTSGCLSNMVQEKVMNACGCMGGHLTYNYRQAVRSGLKLCGRLTNMEMSVSGKGELTVDCNITEDSMINAAQKAYCSYAHSTYNSDVNLSSNDNCLPPCESTSYTTEVTGTPWPDFSYHLSFYAGFIQGAPFAGHFDVYSDILRGLNNMTESIRRIKENSHMITDHFLQIKLVFDEPEVTYFTDAPSVTWEGLLGSLGGALNLWIGISFVTCVEIVELLFKMISQKKNGSVTTNTTNKVQVGDAHTPGQPRAIYSTSMA